MRSRELNSWLRCCCWDGDHLLITMACHLLYGCDLRMCLHTSSVWWAFVYLLCIPFNDPLYYVMNAVYAENGCALLVPSTAGRALERARCAPVMT